MSDDDLTPHEKTHRRLSAPDQHTPAPGSAQGSDSEFSDFWFYLAGFVAIGLIILAGVMMIAGGAR